MEDEATSKCRIVDDSWQYTRWNNQRKFFDSCLEFNPAQRLQNILTMAKFIAIVDTNDASLMTYQMTTSKEQTLEMDYREQTRFSALP